MTPYCPGQCSYSWGQKKHIGDDLWIKFSETLKSTNQCETHPKAESEPLGALVLPPHRPWRRWGALTSVPLPCRIPSTCLSVLVLGLGGAQFLWDSIHLARKPCVVRVDRVTGKAFLISNLLWTGLYIAARETHRAGLGKGCLVDYRSSTEQAMI